MTDEPDRDLAGTRIVITGGSSGIGLECARVLIRRGASVGLVARGEEALAEAAESVEHQVTTTTADVRDLEELNAALATMARELGGLDVVVSCAGVAAYGPFTEMSPDDYTTTIETTLLGAINTAHVAIPYLRQSHGTFIVVGSIAGRVAVPWLSPYAAAKHGIRGFVRSLAVELGVSDDPVKVALVMPGPVDTPFWQHTRTTDGRLPPKLAGVYRADDVAAEVARAIHSPRVERTVGGLMAAWGLVDNIAPNLSLKVLGPIAKLSWRKREQHPRSPDEGLGEGASEANVTGGMRTRPSLLRKLRDWAGIGV